MYQAPKNISPVSKPYSWAGHCRFKINDADSDSEEKGNNQACLNERSMTNKEEESKYCIEWRIVGLKCPKLSRNLDPRFSKYNLHCLKPIKETFVYLRNEKIVKNMKIRRPKCVHLYSHPLKKVTSNTARKLRSLKNMRLLSFRDYGYQIERPCEYSYKNVDPEEAENAGLKCEEMLRLQELDYLLSSTNTLRRLYVMLSCENWTVFERLQSYARRQKNLKGFGFLPHYGEMFLPFRFQDRRAPYQTLYEYDLSPLGPTLEHLEMRYSYRKEVNIRGSNKLYRLSRYTYGKAWWSFPSNPPDLSEEKIHEEVYGEYESPLDQLYQISCNPKLKNFEIKEMELLYFEKGFWNRVLSILQSKPNVKLTFDITLAQYIDNKEIVPQIQDLVSRVNFQGVLQILILETFYLMGTSYDGAGLKTDQFNFDKQYLFGIEKYKIRKNLSLFPELPLL